MTHIDEFESLFKSADKPVFHVDNISIQKILIVIDENVGESEGYVERVKKFLLVLSSDENRLQFATVTGEQFASVNQLLNHIDDFKPDLICTYRNLHISAVDYPYSLGVYVDVLTQVTHVPVLLLPRPDMMDGKDHVLEDTDRVMAVTDHLAGDSRLVTYAALFTQPNGELTLAHVEDEQTYQRYISVIGKLPAIDTDVAREQIMAQLLKEPTDYIESCKVGIQELGRPITVKSTISVGHYLSDYRSLIMDRETDLLVLNTKDEDQMAMHGLAYPLSVEIREIPLLLV